MLLLTPAAIRGETIFNSLVEPVRVRHILFIR